MFMSSGRKQDHASILGPLFQPNESKHDGLQIQYNRYLSQLSAEPRHPFKITYPSRSLMISSRLGWPISSSS